MATARPASRLVSRTIRLFVLAGIIPLLGLAYFASRQFEAVVIQNLTQEMERTARAQGQAILERLIWARKLLSDADEGRPTNAFDEAFASSVRVTAPSPRADTAALALVGSTDAPVIELRRSEADDRVATAALDSAMLWRVSTYLPNGMTLCVFGPLHENLFCNPPAHYGALKPLLAEQASTSSVLTWAGPSGTKYLSAAWDLFLGAEFGAPDWTIVVTADQTTATTAPAVLRRFPLIAVLVTALAALAGVWQIRRRLEPLGQLTAATRSVGTEGSAPEPVVIETGDEIEELASSFNDMTERIGIQLDRLALLSEVDRQILEMSSIREIVALLLTRLPRLIDCSAAAIGVLDLDDPTSLRVHSWSRQRGQPEVTSARLSHLERAELSAISNASLSSKKAIDLLSRLELPAAANNRLYPISHRGELRGFLIVGFARNDVSRRADAEATDVARRLSVAMASFAHEYVLVKQAHFDDLTGLPNRFLFMDRLNRAIGMAHRSAHGLAVLFLDIDRFKTVNDSIGHSAGDNLLRQVARRLESVLRSGETLARLGGDEFAVLLEPADRVATTLVGQRLLDVLSRPFELGESRVYVATSIGVALFPDHGETPEILLRNADAAMYSAKRSGGGDYAFFDFDMNRMARKRLDLESLIREALEDDGFTLAVQPQYRLDSGRAESAELLLRLDRDGRSVPPIDLIPYAEETGLIVEVGRWVLHRSVETLRSMNEHGNAPFRLGINVSARQIRLRAFAEEVIETLDSHGVSPSLLEIELTETAIAEDLATISDNLQALAEAGCRVLLDDFGTGYCSLRYLQQLPIHGIKLDRSFVVGIDANERSRSMTRAIIDLAHELGKTVIAEGVETESELATIRELGCDTAQGYLLARPMPLAGFLTDIGGLTVSSQIVAR